MFAEHGNVLEVAIIKDKRTGNQQGACYAVILCFLCNSASCLQCKNLHLIFAHHVIGAHMVRSCTVFLCLVFRYLCSTLLGASLQQAGVVDDSYRDRGMKGRDNEVLFASKTYHVLGSSLTEEILFFLIPVQSIADEEFHRLESFSHECRGHLTCCVWFNNCLKNVLSVLLCCLLVTYTSLFHRCCPCKCVGIIFCSALVVGCQLLSIVPCRAVAL